MDFRARLRQRRAPHPISFRGKHNYVKMLAFVALSIEQERGLYVGELKELTGSTTGSLRERLWYWEDWHFVTAYETQQGMVYRPTPRLIYWVARNLRKTPFDQWYREMTHNQRVYFAATYHNWHISQPYQLRESTIGPSPSISQGPTALHPPRYPPPHLNIDTVGEEGEGEPEEDSAYGVR